MGSSLILPADHFGHFFREKVLGFFKGFPTFLPYAYSSEGRGDFLFEEDTLRRCEKFPYLVSILLLLCNLRGKVTYGLEDVLSPLFFLVCHLVFGYVFLPFLQILK